MAHTTDAGLSTRTSDPVLLTLRVTAIATVAVLLWQFVTAGELFGPDAGTWVGLHATGAIVLHVVSGLATLAAAALWRLRGAPASPVVLAAVVFVLTFVQAYNGGLQTLWIHVPGAMILTVGAVWLVAWSMRATAAR